MSAGNGSSSSSSSFSSTGVHGRKGLGRFSAVAKSVGSTGLSAQGLMSAVHPVIGLLSRVSEFAVEKAREADISVEPPSFADGQRGGGVIRKAQGDVTPVVPTLSPIAAVATPKKRKPPAPTPAGLLFSSPGGRTLKTLLGQ